MSRTKLLMFLFFLLVLICPIRSFWWYLGEKYASSYNCYDTNRLRLTAHQREVCDNTLNIRKALEHGLQRGVQECGNQFATRRWNCSTNRRYPNLFGNITNKDLKETSFLYALMSASAIFGVIQACSDGDIYMCGCREMDNVPDPKAGWSWGGCSDDLDNAVIRKTKEFVNDPHSKTAYRQTTRNRIALHNNEVGYLTVQNNVDVICKCQGLSGSCTVKTCYRRIPKMEKIGSGLMKKYQHATRVLDWIDETNWTLYDPSDMRPAKSDLVYLSVTNEDAFCVANEAIGSLGTVGRICSITSRGPDNCDTLCCRRSISSRTKTSTQDCNCHFIYEYLETRCQRCTRTIQESICK